MVPRTVMLALTSDEWRREADATAVPMVVFAQALDSRPKPAAHRRSRVTGSGTVSLLFDAEMSTDDEHRVTVEQLEPHLWAITVIGEHDTATEHLLRDALRQTLDPGSHVIVDLSDAAFVDSTVLTSILHAHDRATRDPADGLVVVAPAGSFAARLLEISGLARSLDVYGGRAQAAEAMRTR
jgi:anti-anti-sigma factor